MTKAILRLHIHHIHIHTQYVHIGTSTASRWTRYVHGLVKYIGIHL